MSSQHPWKLFARSIGSSGDLKSQQFSQAKCGGEADGNSSDEDQDIPTMAPPSLASGPRVSSQGSSLATGESSSRSLEGITPSGEATLRTDFESAGASEFLISRVEDMLMDHFYRVEASVFKVECGLKAQAEVCEEQQRYMHDVSERLSQVSADQRCDRARLQELRQDAARCKQTEGSSQASGFLCSSGNLDTKQSDRLLSDLRRDFDQQMARHEDRFITFEQTLRHCSAELADLRAELATAKAQTADSRGAVQPCTPRVVWPGAEVATANPTDSRDTAVQCTRAIVDIDANRVASLAESRKDQAQQEADDIKAIVATIEAKEAAEAAEKAAQVARDHEIARAMSENKGKSEGKSSKKSSNVGTPMATPRRHDKGSSTPSSPLTPSGTISSLRLLKADVMEKDAKKKKKGSSSSSKSSHSGASSRKSKSDSESYNEANALKPLPRVSSNPFAMCSLAEKGPPSEPAHVEEALTHVDDIYQNVAKDVAEDIARTHGYQGLQVLGLEDIGLDDIRDVTRTCGQASSDRITKAK